MYVCMYVCMLGACGVKSQWLFEKGSKAHRQILIPILIEFELIS